MARRLITLAAIGFSLTGCVAQDKYNALKLEKDQAVEQLANAQSDSASARSAAQAWKDQLDRLVQNGNDKESMLALHAKELAELKAQNAELKAKYETAMPQGPVIINGAPLPAELNTALTQLATAHPELLEFDSARGIVKFKSDLTFAKGSAELTPQAKAAAGQLANVLNSSAARNYEFLVAGHTDNTPVNSQSTIAAGHKDNWYLSSHRAISVGKELINHQIDAHRIGVVGYGDQRPIASNATPEGQAKNRRVEVLILPTSYKGNGATLAGGADAHQAAPRSNGKSPPAPAPSRNTHPDLNKDTVITDHRPVFNK